MLHMYVVGSVANSMNEPHLKIIVNAILDLECCQDNFGYIAQCYFSNRFSKYFQTENKKLL